MLHVLRQKSESLFYCFCFSVPSSGEQIRFQSHHGADFGNLPPAGELRKRQDVEERQQLQIWEVHRDPIQRRRHHRGKRHRVPPGKVAHSHSGPVTNAIFSV